MANIFPNPTSNIFSIEGVPINNEQIQLFNSFGQEVTAYVSFVQRNDKHLVIDLNNLTSGIYIIKGISFTRRIVKI